MLRNLYLSYLKLNYPERLVTDTDVDTQMLKQFGLRMLTRVLLFCYALLMMKPVMPLLQDKVAHQLFFAQHIKVVHNENGKQHVHYQLAKEAKDAQKDKSEGKTKIEISDVVFILPQVDNAHFKSVFAQPLFFPYRSIFPIIYSEPNFIPPKACQHFSV